MMDAILEKRGHSSYNNREEIGWASISNRGQWWASYPKMLLGRKKNLVGIYIALDFCVCKCQ
jgi:hypothetical protein